MSRWLRRAVRWAVLTAAAFVVVVALEGGAIRGIMLAVATVAISASVSFIIRDMHRAPETGTNARDSGLDS